MSNTSISRRKASDSSIQSDESSTDEEFNDSNQCDHSSDEGFYESDFDDNDERYDDDFDFGSWEPYTISSSRRPL